MKTKNILQFSKLLFIFSIAFASCNTANKEAVENKESNDSTALVLAPENEEQVAPSSGAIVFINTDSVWENYQKVIDMKADLLNEKNTSEKQFQKEAGKLEKEVTEFRARARFQTQPEIEKKQQELMMQEQSLMQLEEQLTMKLAESEREKNIEITEDVRAMCQIIAKEKGYQYVLSFSSAMASDVLYGDSNNEITEDILSRLNEAYKNKVTNK